MKRSSALTPLAHHHHAALEHALRLRRSTEADVELITSRFLVFMAGAGCRHFDEEESILLPVLPADAADAGHRLVREHEELLGGAEALGADPTADAARALGEALAAHVRFEERELFPLLEARLAPHVLEDVGRRLVGG